MADASHSQKTPYDFASAADIIRASQKDQYYSSVLSSQLEAVLRRVLGSRSVTTRKQQITSAAQLIYLALTTAIGRTTLGEEYCDIAYSDASGSALPSLQQRIIFVCTSILGPYAISRLWPRLTTLLSTISLSKRLPLPQFNLQPVLNLRSLQSIHLAIFYFKEAYYSLATRASGLRYIFIRKMHESTERIGYEVLGFLMVARLLLPLYSNMLATGDSHSTEIDDTVQVRNNLEDQSIMPFLQDQARTCTLCLSKMQDPTATPCGHLFCWSCISEWTRTKPECPLCRQHARCSHLLPLQA